MKRVKVVDTVPSIKKSTQKIGKGLSVISTGKETHHQMQRAYLKGKRTPLAVTSIDTNSWIKELRNGKNRQGNSIESNQGRKA